MRIPRGGQHIGHAGLCAGILHSSLGRRIEEIDVPEIFHILSGSIRRCDLDQTSLIPESMPPGTMTGCRGMPQSRMNDRRGILAAVIMRRCRFYPEMPILEWTERDCYRQRIRNSNRYITSLSGNCRQGTERASGIARMLVIDPGLGKHTGLPAYGCSRRARLPKLKAGSLHPGRISTGNVDDENIGAWTHIFTRP